MYALHNGSDPLQSHAGIDTGVRKRFARAIRLLLELHEDQVPDFDVAIQIVIGATGRTTGHVRPVIVKDF